MAEHPEMADPLTLGELLDSERQRGIATDITLVCEGKYFPAHKMILSATSDYFRAMFSTDWAESKSNIVEIPSVGAEEMDVIISFLYTRKIKDVDDQSLLQALVQASHFLQIRSLFKCSYKKLCESLNCVSFLETCNLAFLYADEGMLTLVLTFFAEHLEEISNSEEFLKLNETQLQKICQHPNILMSCMDIVINGLFRWTQVEEDREKTLLKILINLDLKRLSSVFLLETLSERALVKRNHNISTLFIGEATRRTLALSLNSIKNQGEPKLLTFGVNASRQVFRMYDVNLNQWSAAKTLPFCLEAYMTTVWFGDHVYIFGGGSADNIKPSAEVIKYCPVTNTIASFGNLAAPMSSSGAGVIHENIYVVNGINEKKQAVTTVQCYNPVTSVCETIARTNKAHTRPHVLPFDKYLIVLGSVIHQNSVERYDPKFDTWTLITNIPGEIDWCSAAFYKERLFVVPKHVTSYFQMYDFTTAHWKQFQLEVSPSKIVELRSVTVDGKSILLFRDNKKVLHLLDLAHNGWINLSKRNCEPWHPRMTCVV